MAELKTQANTASVTAFLNTTEPELKRKDALQLLELFENITGEPAVMWGTSIVGFGKYHYKSERSAQEGDWPLIGFSPRKQNLTLYIMSGVKKHEDLIKKLGKCKTSGGCLYINNLADVDQKVLMQIIKKSYDHMKKTTTPA